MGCKDIRTSHNLPAPELLDLFDKIGFIVINVSFNVGEVFLNKIFSNNFQNGTIRFDKERLYSQYGKITVGLIKKMYSENT